MARIPLEHDKLYFDVLIRTQTSESLLALIKASYYAYKNKDNLVDVKEEIAKRLKSAYELYRDNIRGSDSGAGSYTGSEAQFESQYTLGHEMAIWNDSSLSLTFLANKVAVGELAVKEYITNIFLSYLQPIDGKMIHPLYMILDYMEQNCVRYIEKSCFERALMVECSTEQCNSLFNYFDYSGNKLYLKKEFELRDIKEKCNKLFLKESYSNIIKNLSDSDRYEAYLIEPYFNNELKLPEAINYVNLSKQFQLWLLSNLNPNKKENSNFNGYSHNIFKVVSCLESKNKILHNSMYKKNIEYYDFVLLKYENDQEAKEIDKKQHYPARAALPLYKIFISQINKYGYNKIEKAIEQNKNITDLSYSCLDEKKQYWLCSANSAIYDHDSAFHTNCLVDWAQDKHFKKANIGDVVFIYSTSPIKRVKYKCIITKKDITKADKVSDVQYWANPIQDEEYKGLYIRFELLKESDDNRLTYDNLLKVGLKSAPQGAMKLDDEYLALANYIDSIFEKIDLEELPNKINNFVSDFEIKRKAKNLVVFGTPGCGKSYYVNNTLLKNYPDKSDNTKERVFRTTFYQDYTNTDFVGQILPYIEYNEKKEEKVTYKFTPGPFALALKEAVLNRNEDVALVIEELNRGNAPAIFGDIFQLLDRNQDGISEYAITNIHLRDWLNHEIDGANFDKIKIPGNLNIFATMNTSDQNVFTLDTAFKRRWEFKKLKNEFKGHPYEDYFVPGLEETTWKTFVEVINKAIVGELGERNSTINVSDKQIGVYFVDKDGLHKEQIDANDLTKDEKIDKFAYKIFSYLWEDVAKFDKDQLFKKGIITLDQLIENYIKHEVVFNDSINDSLKKKDSDSSEN